MLLLLHATFIMYQLGVAEIETEEAALGFNIEMDSMRHKHWKFLSHFDIKTLSRYSYFDYKDKMVVWLSYLYGEQGWF